MLNISLVSDPKKAKIGTHVKISFLYAILNIFSVFFLQYIAASPHPNTYPYCAATPSIIHTVPIAASEEHPPNAVSPEDYQQFPLK